MLGAGCADAVDPACAAMCATAGEAYGACLADWGVDWSAAGLEDEADYVDRCETWAWEMGVLERDARARGEAVPRGATEAACVERDSLLSAEGATCTDLTAIDWTVPPWQAG